MSETMRIPSNEAIQRALAYIQGVTDSLEESAASVAPAPVSGGAQASPATTPPPAESAATAVTVRAAGDVELPPIQAAKPMNFDAPAGTSGPRVTLYGSLGSKHVGGDSFISDQGVRYMEHRYDWFKPNIGIDPKTGRERVYPSSAVVVGDNGKFNHPFNEKNPGGSVNVMWPVTKTENGVVEAGGTLGSYRNSFDNNTTYLAGSIAYRLPKAIESPLGTTALAAGVEVGRATGYPKKFIGQVYAEACHNLTDKLAVCAKLGVIPTRFEKAQPEKLIGTEHALKPGAASVTRDENDKIKYYHTAEPLHTPVVKSNGFVVSKQVGISWNF